MLYAAIVVTLITVVSAMDELNIAQIGFVAPLMSATLVGIFLGDVKTGLIIGAQLQMIFLGMISIGASVPPDMVIGTTISTALVILSGADIELAFVVALPIAMLGQLINIGIRTAATALIHWADAAAKKGDYKKMSVIHLMGIPLYSLRAVIVFPAIYFGTDLIEKILASIPDFLSRGLSFAGGLLPAVGFGMLLTIMGNKRLIAFYFLGFALASFTGCTVMGVALFAVCFALIMDYVCFVVKKSSVKEDDHIDALDDLME